MHPRQALFDAASLPAPLPVCDHYAGLPKLMEKSLALQAEKGPVFDVTLDCEDGAAVGGEAEHAHRVAELVMSPSNAYGRVGVRLHALDHPAFADDVLTLLKRAGPRLAYMMLPKSRHADDVETACKFMTEIAQGLGITPPPIHALIETHGALAQVQRIAAQPEIESLSFGLMDFVAAHRGAIGTAAMTAVGQFSHPLVWRAKLEISAACHAQGITPSHSVVTEFRDRHALAVAAEKAATQLGYMRMWSIHPSQIDTIVEAFAPSTAELDLAIEIIQTAQAQDWAPTQHGHVLHDRASYRHFWFTIERAAQTRQLPIEIQQLWFPTSPAEH